MARIDISGPYKEYLDSLVKAGFYRSITAAAEAAIRKQMLEEEKMRFSSVAAALAKGEADVLSGRTVRYTESLMAGISEKGKQAALQEKPVKPDVR